MSKHTPKPWHIGGIFNPGSAKPTVWIWSHPAPGMQSGEVLARDVDLKNGPLIALAPELLADSLSLIEEVEAIARGEFGVDWADTYGPLFQRIQDLRSTIAKAKGESA